MDIIKEMPLTTAMVYALTRQKGGQLRQPFLNIGLKQLDMVVVNEVPIDEIPCYDLYLVEYEYKYHNQIRDLVLHSRFNAPFGSRPIFIFQVINQESTIDIINANELTPDFIVEGPQSTDNINELVKKSIRLRLAISKTVLAKGKDRKSFLTRMKMQKTAITNRVLLNTVLTECRKQDDKEMFLSLMASHNLKDILAENLIAYCEMTKNKQAVRILESLIKSNRYLFSAHRILADISLSNKQLKQTKEHLISAFNYHPQHEGVFDLLLRFIAEHRQYNLLKEVVIKRLLYSNMTIDSFSNICISMALYIEKYDIKFSSRDFHKYFSRLILDLKRRLSPDRRNDAQALVNILSARHSLKQNKAFKAKYVATDSFNRYVRGNRRLPQAIQLITFDVLALVGESNALELLIKNIQMEELKKVYPVFVKEAITAYKKLAHVNKTIHSDDIHQISLNNIKKLVWPYRFASDINHHLLITLLQRTDVRTNPEVITMSLRMIRNLERTNKLISEEKMSDDMVQNKQVLERMLAKH